MTNDAVLGLHLNPQTCGVAKFNDELARRLGVPHLPLHAHAAYFHPLVSIKPSELTPKDWPKRSHYDVFLHGPGAPRRWVSKAHRVFAANRVLVAHYRLVRPDIIPAWCPSTINGNPTRGTYRVLTFGMAHKLALTCFRHLKHTLDTSRLDYTVAMSTAVHEGSPWDTALAESVAAMREIFGDRLRVLGYLGDDALAKELEDCDAVAVYFDPAVRENNTTVWAAVQAGKTIYTNTDKDSPSLNADRYSWDGLVHVLQGGKGARTHHQQPAHR